RDISHPPQLVQFRLDLRSACQSVTSWLRGKPQSWAQDGLVKVIGGSLRVAELFAVSFVLQLGMLPLMARDFHRVSLLGPVANLFAVPLTGVIVPLGFFSLGIASIFPRLAVLIAHPLVWLVFAQQRIVSFLAAVPRGSYRIPAPPAWVTASFLLIALVMAIRLRRGQAVRRWEWSVLSLLLILLAAMIALHPFRPTITANDLEVTVLDVAQGDSILVVSPKGSTLLIDGGGAF